MPAARSHFVAMDGRTCVGFYAEFHFDTLRGEAELATGGLAVVGVVPDRRHTGVGSDLMRFALHDMRRRGKVLASLYPFAESYYRQFGYEVCGSRLKLSAPKSYLPILKPALPIRRLRWEEFDQVKSCYDVFAKSRSGLARRDDYLWGRLFGLKRNASTPAYEKTVYAAGDPVEGYAVVSHVIDFHIEQAVSELAWSTSRGYDTMLTFMRSLAANKSGLRWYEPSDSPFYFRHLSSSAFSEAHLEKPIMYRVLNVPAALSALVVSADAKFTLSVSDADIPENEGPWSVTASGRSVRVEKSATAELHFDIRSFTQALLGQPSIDDALRNGYVTATSTDAANAFRTMMPPTPVYCLDMF
ncbi:MAG: GNAT family N-acetyltransferase [Fimbriimonadaceae bacterium]